ncbi:MAG: hypothetical protein ACRENG_11680 [bacterium]
MRQAFPHILKFAGALIITTAIFFLLSPEEKIDDQVVNASMEFLGSKLLAMVPQDQKPHVEKEFESFREQTRNGKVSNEQFEGVAVAILNAEAEGRKFQLHEVDSLLASIKQAKAARAEDEVKRHEELIAMSERVQAFQEFEHHWKKIMPPPPPDSAGPPGIPPRPPLYRISSNFVVEIDTAAIAEITVKHAGHFAEQAPQVLVMPPREVFRELARELPALKFEMRKLKWQTQIADSVRRAFEWSSEHQQQMPRAMVQIQVVDSVLKALEQNPQYQSQMRRARLQTHRADSIRKESMERYRRERPPQAPMPSDPPLPPEVAEPERKKPPQ